jgi:hypothetical protein
MQFFIKIPKKKASIQLSLFFGFADTLNSKQPLFILANKIACSVFKKAFEPL